MQLIFGLKENKFSNFSNILFIVLCIWLTDISNAQNNVKFHELNEQQGLSNTVINTIVQDTLGFVWIGTEDGLFRYNGSEFESFREQNLTKKIPNNTVNKLFVDSQNRLWILTNNGLGLYNYSSDQITHYFTDDDDLWPEEKIFTAIIEHADGTIFLGNAAGHIYNFDNDQFHYLYFANELADTDLYNLNISDFVIDGDLLWISTWYNGVFRLNIKTLKIQQSLNYKNAATTLINTMAQESNGNIFLGTNKGLQYITPFGINTFKIKDLGLSIDNEVLSIYQDADDKLWVGTRNDGLYQLNTNNQGQFFIEKHYTAGISANTISHRTVSTIVQDRIGKIWLGTHSKGINIFDPNGEKVAHIEPPILDLNSDNNITSVWGIVQDHTNGFWFSTDGAGLFHYALDSEKTTKVASTEGPIVINDNAILCMTKTQRNDLWLGSYSSGITVIDLKTKKTTVFTANKNSNGLQSNDIRAIHQDKNGRIWIGTNRGGLHYYNPSAKSIVSIPNTTALDIRGVVDDPVNSNILWLASYGDGLIKYNKTERSIVTYNWNTNSKKEIPIALCIAYNHNRIWIGTKNRGLKSFDLKTETFETLDTEKELSGRTVRAIVPLGQRVWFSTNRGVSLFDVASKKISNYNTIDGLKFSQFNDGAALLSTTGNLAFGSVHGLNMFNPNEIVNQKNLTDVTFTDLSYNNLKAVPVDTKGVLHQSIPIAKTLHFNSEIDIFSIQFNKLDFDPSSDRSYAYFLEGYDSEWTIESNANVATYRHVPPGDYTFKARAYDNASEHQGPITKIRIRIAPKWWQTGWAFICFTLLGISALIFIYRYNRRRITQNQKVFYEQKLREQEYNTMEEKMRFYTNFSHELRTPITLILGPINDLLNSNDINKSQEKTLFFVKRNANTLLKLVNRLLDFRKIDTENIRLNLGHYDISILAKEEGESFAFLAKERDIIFKYHSESELMVWVDIEKIQIILNNLLANAFKFSKSGSRVTFNAYAKGSTVCFDIIDEGRGIAKDELKAIFQPFYQAKNSSGTGGSGLGLSLSKHLVELHGGTLFVESELGKGAKFTVTIKQGKTHFKSQTNTQFIEVQKGDVSDHILMEEEVSEEITVVEQSAKQVILVVDDNLDIRNYVGSLFEEQYTLLYAENGQKALRIAQDVSPDMIISDVMMPEMDGYELCRKLKRNITTSHIPILLLTAKTENSSKIDGFNDGADAYITKPFDSQVLTVRVENLLQSRAVLKKYFEITAIKGKETTHPNSVEINFLNKVESKVLEMIPTGNLTVVGLSTELGFSRTSLYRKIKSLTGLSINQFIRSIKLKKAADLLVFENMNVSEVAFSLDFTDLKYFRNVFKKQYGMMPSEYIKTHKTPNKVDQKTIKKTLNI